MLEAGDYINADGRLLESHNLHINESSLTGESIAVAKVQTLFGSRISPLRIRKIWCTQEAL